MASQQSSFNGMRMALACQRRMASRDASSDGPSKMPFPWTQLYSVPARLTPRSCTAAPEGSTSLLPEARSGTTAPVPLPGPLPPSGCGPASPFPPSGFGAAPPFPPVMPTPASWPGDSTASPTLPPQPAKSPNRSSAAQAPHPRELKRGIRMAAGGTSRADGKRACAPTRTLRRKALSHRRERVARHCLRDARKFLVRHAARRRTLLSARKESPAVPCRWCGGIPGSRISPQHGWTRHSRG